VGIRELNQDADRHLFDGIDYVDHRRPWLAARPTQLSTYVGRGPL